MTYIAIPAAPLVWQGTMSFGDISYGSFLNIAESSDPSGIASVSGGNAIVLAKAGTYYVTAMAHTTSQVFGDGSTWRLEVWGNGTNLGTRFTSATTPVNGNQGGGNSRAWCSCMIAMSAGNYFQIRGITTTAGAWAVSVPDGNVEVIFIPVTATPKPF